jgi:hypothetical protein
MSNNLFMVHRLNEDGMKKADRISDIFEKAYNDLSTVCTIDSREFKIVQQKLEEACFFAKKSMAMVPKNQAK